MSLLDVLFGRRFGLKLVYHEDYWMVDLGRHVFSVRKYRDIYERLMTSGARSDSFLRPEPASDEDLALVHNPKYIRRLKAGELSRAEVACLEVPYSAELAAFAWLHVGGTILAAGRALADGVCVHIGGGFHHAFPDHGEGFCALNDIAVALERLHRDGRIARAMVVDCDVHQGNGTAAALAGKDWAFTFSIHQMDIYPAEKARSSLDVGLWSGDGDEKILGSLRENFPALFRSFRPDLVLYVAGADPLRGDRLGGLEMSPEGLRARDRLILGSARALGIPVAVTLAGGYARELSETVAVHLNTIREAERARRL